MPPPQYEPRQTGRTQEQRRPSEAPGEAHGAFLLQKQRIGVGSYNGSTVSGTPSLNMRLIRTGVCRSVGKPIFGVVTVGMLRHRFDNRSDGSEKSTACQNRSLRI